MERSEWLEARRKCITGTDISAIVGMNPYRTPMDVFMDKMGMSPETPDNDAMFWGRTLEEVVANKYASDSGVKLIKGELVVKDKWLAGTPDFLIDGQKKGLEIKTTGAHMASKFGESGSDEIPAHFMCQVAWYQMLCGFDDWDLSVLIGGNDYRCFSIRRSPRLENQLLRRAEEFRERYILTKTAPSLDGTKSSDEYLKAMFPKHTRDSMKPANVDLDLIAGQLHEARLKAKELDDQITLFEQTIKNEIGDSPGIIGTNWEATWKSTKTTKKTDWCGLAESLKPSREEIERYSKTVEGSRRFLFKVKEQ